jgi:predicted phosphodiesterase
MRLFSIVFVALSLVYFSPSASKGSFQFAILGDRTGEAQTGVYEQVWRDIAKQKPRFVVSVGDTIQGTDDHTALREWQQIQAMLQPYKRITLYLAPGNHDVWSERSQALFERFSHHATHYSFDVDQLHVTVLDTSRSDTLSETELKFLESDLSAHSSQPLKIVVSHRPFWLFPVLFAMSQSPVHQLLLKYGVRYVFTGHLHKMVHAELGGITYLCLPSSGGHLRDTKRYEDGWFFGHTSVGVEGDRLNIRFEETGPPYGQGRITTLDDWGVAGLVKAAA